MNEGWSLLTFTKKLCTSVFSCSALGFCMGCVGGMEMKHPLVLVDIVLCEHYCERSESVKEEEVVLVLGARQGPSSAQRGHHHPLSSASCSETPLPALLRKLTREAVPFCPLGS